MSIPFLLWNLFLAAIPVFAAYGLVRVDRSVNGRRRNVSLCLIGAVWMAFLPNSCYLMTEWRHFLFHPHFQAIRDVTNPNDLSVLRVLKQASFFVAYSGFGVLCFTLAIRPVSGLIERRGWRPLLLAIPFFFAVSLGVYLGLILRLNSWDLVTNPLGVVAASLRAILNPVLLLVMIAFAGFLAMLYVVCDIWFEGLAFRLSKVDGTSECPRAADSTRATQFRPLRADE